MYDRNIIKNKIKQFLKKAYLDKDKVYCHLLDNKRYVYEIWREDFFYNIFHKPTMIFMLKEQSEYDIEVLGVLDVREEDIHKDKNFFDNAADAFVEVPDNNIWWYYMTQEEIQDKIKKDSDSIEDFMMKCYYDRLNNQIKDYPCGTRVECIESYLDVLGRHVSVFHIYESKYESGYNDRIIRDFEKYT